jgi:hypothetical protein
VLPLLGKGYEAMRIETKVTCSCLAVGMACVTAFGQANFQFGVAGVFNSDGSMTPASAGAGDSGDVMDPVRIMIDDRQISIEVFVTLLEPLRVKGHQLGFPCELISDLAGRPPITYVPGSAEQFVRPDVLLAGENVVRPLDRGSCDESIPCTDHTDCPPNTVCWVDGFCTLAPPRTASAVFSLPPGGDLFVERLAGTYYIGEALYDIPAGAAGDYAARPDCLWSDGCPNVSTATMLVTESYDEATPATATSLIVRIPFGACCDGSFCAGDVLESDCPSPFVWNPGASCADADCPEEVRPVPAMTTSGSAVLVLLLVVGLATTAGRRGDARA